MFTQKFSILFSWKKRAVKTSAVSIFVFLDVKDDTPTAVSPSGMHSFLLLLYFYSCLLFLMNELINLFLFACCCFLRVKRMWMHVQSSQCLCVAMPLVTDNLIIQCCVENTFTGVKLMFVTGVTYIPTWRTRKMVNQNILVFFLSAVFISKSIRYDYRCEYQTLECIHKNDETLMRTLKS